MWIAVAWLAVLRVSVVNGIAEGQIASFIPWQAAIYKSTNGDLPICGGTLVSEDFVISSASCFTDEAGTVQQLADFTIVFGKGRSRKNAVEEGAQERRIKELIIPERFKVKLLSFTSDIALVQLSSAIVLTDAVQPIRIDLNRDDLDLEGQQGQVAGWGLTEDGQQTEELRVVSLPYLNFSACLNQVPNNFQHKITNDKFCAGYRDGPHVCVGDYGSGWTIQDTFGYYYLRGVLNEGQKWASLNGQCKRGIAVFTSVAAHRDWLKLYIASSSAALLSASVWFCVSLVLWTL